MNARAKKLLQEVLELPREEREEVARDVLVSLAQEDSKAAKVWSETIRTRADDVLAGRELGAECRPFVAELRERLRREG
jgi:hypothetical protein